MNYPRQTPHVHIQAIGDELCVYDWQRRRVHALNPTAALVWQHCDGATPADYDCRRAGGSAWEPRMLERW